MTITILPTRPACALIWGSRWCISNSDGAISPTVSPVSTAYPLSLGSLARGPLVLRPLVPRPLLTRLLSTLEAEAANRDIDSPQAITVLVVAESEQESQLLHQAWRAI